MPKQTYKIEGFHGGLNSYSDARDVKDIEIPSLNDVSVDALGKIKTLGGVTDANDNPGTSNALTDNIGLFVMGSDRQLDGGESQDESIIFCYNANTRSIDAKDSEGWDFNVISCGISGGCVPNYYSADGVLRIGDSGFINNTRRFEYVEDERFNGLNSDSNPIGWVDSDQNILSPTVGKCLISTPSKHVNQDSSNGINGPLQEYNGVATDTTSRHQVLEKDAVNLRVGVQNKGIIEELNSVGGWDNTLNAGFIADPITNKPYSFLGINYTIHGNTESQGNYLESENVIQTDSEITINDVNHIVHPFYITSGREYSDLENIEIRWGRSDHEADTSGEPIYWSWKFEKNEIKPDCWNLLVLNPSNFNDTFDPETELSFGQFITYCRITVNRVFSSNGRLSAQTPSYKISTPFIIENPGLTAFGPGEYTFHYTWLYDNVKQESLPFKFNDVDTEININTDTADHTGGDNPTIFTSGETPFVVDDLIGRRLQNLGDATTVNNVSVPSEGFVRDNANNTVQVTSLLHGANNNFSNDDDIKILPITNNKINIVGGYVLFNFDIYNIVKPAIPCSTTASSHLVNSTAHGLVKGLPLEFTNSDEGRITDNSIMYVSSASLTTNSFRISDTLANALAGTSIDFVSSDDASLEYRTYSINRRITGSRLYWKLEDKENYYLIGEQDFIENGFKWFPSSDKLAYDMESANEQSDNWLKYSSIIKGISPESANLIDTFRNINGFDANVDTLSAKFKTATVSGRRCYIGNIEQNGKKYPDRILKSQINKFDTFPDEVNALDVAVRDGDSIVKLESYADRILQFKKHSMYIINVASNVDFLEDEFRNKGCVKPYHVAKTDYGVAWFNAFGVYFYDGKQVANLLEKGGVRLISESDWEIFIKDGTDDTDMSSAHIGYIPKKRQLLIKNENTDIYLYDFILQSWVKGSSKIDRTSYMTNFAINDDNDLFYITSTTFFRKIWTNTPQDTTNFLYSTKDIDFGEPGVRKKIYKVYLSYKGDADQLHVRYTVNGQTDYSNGFQFQSGQPLEDKDSSEDMETWHLSELKPSNSQQSNNVYSFRLFIYGTTDADFAINDICIVYRMKNIK